MVFNLFLVLLSAYLFYQNGTRFLFQARISNRLKREHLGYFMLMAAGTMIGEFVGISMAYRYFHGQFWMQIGTGTACSIGLGEVFYFYARQMTRRIPLVRERKNFLK
jgi:hypothetical protein